MINSENHAKNHPNKPYLKRDYFVKKFRWHHLKIEKEYLWKKCGKSLDTWYVARTWTGAASSLWFYAPSVTMHSTSAGQSCPLHDHGMLYPLLAPPPPPGQALSIPSLYTGTYFIIIRFICGFLHSRLSDLVWDAYTNYRVNILTCQLATFDHFDTYLEKTHFVWKTSYVNKQYKI
jgi:hypothetical protein